MADSGSIAAFRGFTSLGLGVCPEGAGGCYSNECPRLGEREGSGNLVKHRLGDVVLDEVLAVWCWGGKLLNLRRPRIKMPRESKLPFS